MKSATGQSRRTERRAPSAIVSSLVLCLAALLLCAGCRPPGKPTEADVELNAEEVRDFATLSQQNCGGCHGRDGKGSPAIALANPVYWSIANDDTIRRVI